MSKQNALAETENQAKPWYCGHRQRMADKIRTKGVESLTEAELLEELLMRAIPRRDVKPLARTLLNEFKTLGGVLQANTNALIQIKGIKENTATFLHLIRATAQVVALGNIQDAPILSDWERLLDYATTLYTGETIETLYVLYLDSKLKLIRSRKERVGSVNHVAVSPREILKQALNENASQVIMIHNHPSGDVAPSADDIRTTKEIARMLESAGILLVEHLIIGANRKVHSMRLQGVLANRKI